MEGLPLFINHYQTKLQINNIYFDVCFVSIFIFCVFITRKKSFSDRSFSLLQTTQIRGLAITLIILNHICYYTDPPPSLYSIWSRVGEIGVATFLMISGYGLCISLEMKGIELFFTKRISKILIPLILALSFLQILYLTLTADGGSLALALPQVLFSMYSLDRKTWFVIFILFWYCLLYLTYRFQLSSSQKIFFLFLVSGIIISLPQAQDLAKINALSFPVGCWLGINSSWVEKKLDRILDRSIAVITFYLIGAITSSILLIWHLEKIKDSSTTLMTILCLLLIVAIFIIYYGYLYFKHKKLVKLSSEKICSGLVVILIYLNYTSQVFDQNITGDFNIYWGSVRSLINIIFAFSLILLVSLTVKFQVYSPLLNFLGNISLELFLIHNTFLVHFDFFLFRLPIAIGFIIYFVMVCLFSIIFKQVCKPIIKIVFAN